VYIADCMASHQVRKSDS